VNQPADDLIEGNARAIDDEKLGNGPSTCLRVGPILAPAPHFVFSWGEEVEQWMQLLSCVS